MEWKTRSNKNANAHFTIVANTGRTHQHRSFPCSWNNDRRTAALWNGNQDRAYWWTTSHPYWGRVQKMEMKLPHVPQEAVVVVVVVVVAIGRASLNDLNIYDVTSTLIKVLLIYGKINIVPAERECVLLCPCCDSWCWRFFCRRPPQKVHRSNGCRGWVGVKMADRYLPSEKLLLHMKIYRFLKINYNDCETTRTCRAV